MGGALFVRPNVNYRIERSTIAGNSAQKGGGVAIVGPDSGALVIDTSTLSGNRDATRGGAIAHFGEVPVQIRASTIVANSAPQGGGIDAADAVLSNTLIANNLGGNCDIFAFKINGSSSLSSDQTCRLDPANSLVNTSAKLGPLQFNGGPTRTHALLEGSPAIDGGSFHSLAIAVRPARRLSASAGRSAPAAIRTISARSSLNAFGVGEFDMTAPAAAVAEQPITLNASWVHPVRWRDLNTVELQLRRTKRWRARVVYTEGITDTAGISVTDGLALYNSDGTIAGVGSAGRGSVLESDTALLDLAGQHACRAAARRAKASACRWRSGSSRTAAGKVYTTTVLASDDEGQAPGPARYRTLAVGPFRSALPLVSR